MDIINKAPSDVVSFYECERLVQELQSFDLSKYASKDWLRQHELISKLNIQAHINAMTRGEEYVMESISTFEKMPVLLHELLLSNIWKREILTRITVKVAQCGIKGYISIFHENLVLNLIEIVCFHKTALMALDHYIVDLVDYCYDKISMLVSRGNKDFPFTKKISEVGSPTEELAIQRIRLEFNMQMSCLSILRYISDYLGDLGISAVTFVVNERDVLMALVALIEARPWLARSESGKRLVWEDNEFKEISPSEYDKVPKIEGQVWLCIYNLIFGKGVATSYEITESRKNWLLRLKKYLNDLLVDQIPVLAHLKVMLDQMALSSTVSVAKSSPFVISTVPEIKERIIKNSDFAAIAQKQANEIFSQEFSAAEFEELGRLGELYTNDIFDYESKDEDKHICANCGIDASKRCSRCKTVWYCSKECQVKHFKESHKKNCKDITTIQNKGNQETGAILTKTKPVSEDSTQLKLVSNSKRAEEDKSRIPQKATSKSIEKEKSIDYEELC
jgi:hypothetical protein